jgi:CPA1 family monovalent cation:H+ antiporter
MAGNEINHVELILLGLMLLVAALAVLAKRLQIAYPIIMVIGGLLVSLLPRMPHIRLDPDVVFLIILPPLLFSAAYQISWREFRRNLVSILLLAFGLVGFTVYGVAATTRWLLPGFDWHMGLVLGAVIAATDAIAATATAKRLGLPRRITELLEAESLVNDGSGLVALRFTLALIVTGVTPSFAVGVWTLFYLIAMGVLIGLVIGVLVYRIQSRINDSPIEITISLITPYVAYLAAEAANCSGVLATLACGIYLGRRSGFFSVHARIEGFAVWKTLDFVLNGVVFLMLGLQLPWILAEMRGVTLSELIGYGALFSLIVIGLRMLWVFPGAWLSAWFRRRVLKQEVVEFSSRSVFIVGWAGMRGVLALAAAFSLPNYLHDGSPFPQRNIIIFLTFCVIFSTLVLQGLSMPVLIRALGLTEAAKTAAATNEEQLARLAMVTSALNRLNQLRMQEGDEQAGLYDRVQSEYQRRLIEIRDAEPGSGRQPAANQREEARHLAQELRNVERSVAVKLRNENKIHDELLRTLQYELDLLDMSYADEG